MPRVARTIIPRIQRSLWERGLATTLRRSLLLPLHLLREYLNARALRPNPDRNDFDQKHGVDTGGAFDGWVYLSDLDIPSPNWIDGNDYLGIDPERFEVVLSSLGIALDDFTFIDFGSGKGRALMLASEHPFKRIIGLEFSPELHRIAEENIPRYISPTQKCRDVRSLNVDFADYVLPSDALVLFFFRPCGVRVLSKVMAEVGRSLLLHPRPLFMAYVAPTAEQEELFASTSHLERILVNAKFRFYIYCARL